MMRALHHQQTAVSLFSFRHLFTPTVIRATSSAINGSRCAGPRISLSLHYIRDYECNRDAAAASIFDFICCLSVCLFVCLSYCCCCCCPADELWPTTTRCFFVAGYISSSGVSFVSSGLFFIICLVQFMYYCRRCEY